MNEFYEASVERMHTQINYLQELIGRNLTDDELENLHEFFSNLDPSIQHQFVSQVGDLI